MKFEFITDKEKNTITIEREFAADRQMVWNAYTQSELLDQWFAPKPFTTKTKYMDFNKGGYWLYAMIDPEGKEHWGRMDYTEIKPIDFYKGLDGFCDNKGELNPKLPRSIWEVNFKDFGDNTLVHNVVKYKTLTELETVIKMGMKEGLISTLQRLDELLAKLSN